MITVAKFQESQSQLLGSSIVLATDLLAICCASYATDHVYHSLIVQHGSSSVYSLVSGLAVGLIYFLISCFDDQSVTALNRSAVRRIAWKFIVSLSIFLSSVFVLKIGAVFSRGQFLLFAFAGLFLILVNRQFFSMALKAGLIRFAFKPQRLAVIGDSSEIKRAREQLFRKPSQFSVIETFDINTINASSVMDRTIGLSRDGSIDAILLAMPWGEPEKLLKVVDGLRQQALPIMLLPDIPASHFISHPAVVLADLPAYVIKRASLAPFEQLLKRVADIVFSLCALAVTWPIFLMVALAIKLDTPGPVFFRQKRCGFNRREFTILKFRTMFVCEDAETVKQAVRNDPRLSAVGAFLRKTSIDELPQLFNVLRGEMSLVGPRPHAIAHDREWAQAVEFYARRHHIKPGITGLAQVNGFRGETNTEDKICERVRYDLQYIDNWSVWLDIQIMFRTLAVFAFQKTAY